LRELHDTIIGLLNYGHHDDTCRLPERRRDALVGLFNARTGNMLGPG
jgi:hypothetical protein